MQKKKRASIVFSYILLAEMTTIAFSKIQRKLAVMVNLGQVKSRQTKSQLDRSSHVRTGQHQSKKVKSIWNICFGRLVFIDFA